MPEGLDKLVDAQLAGVIKATFLHFYAATILMKAKREVNSLLLG